jgi:hypothetical protein
MKKATKQTKQTKEPGRPVGLACLLLAMAALAAYALYAALNTFYPGGIVVYGWSAYEADPFERAFLFWFGGLALLATVGVTLGLGLLLPGPRRSGPPHPPSVSLRLSVLVAAAALALLLTAKFAVLHNSPTMDDENVYHFTARLLAQGRLSLPTDLPADFFAGRWGVNYRNGRLYPMYSHGWPALLALGYLVRVPWLINALVALATLLLAADFARRVYGADAARLAMLFFLFSPFFILTGATDLAPPATALGAMIVVACSTRYLDDRRVRWLWLCGAGGALSFQARQLNAISLLTPFFLYLLYRLWKDEGLTARAAGRAAALVLPVAASAAIYLAANYAMNGSPFLPGYIMEFRARGVKTGNPLGFGGDYPLLVGGAGLHTVGMGLMNSALNLIRLNTWLLGWPLALLLVPAARFNLWTRLILTAFGLELLAYTTFFNPGLCVTGPTYYYDSAALLLVLAAAGLARLGAWYRTLPAATHAPRLEGALLAAILFVNLVMFVPTYLRSIYYMAEGTSLLPRTLEEEGIHQAVVFVKNVQAPLNSPGLYRSFAYHLRSNASFDDDVVLLNDRGPEQNREALRKYFPGRTGYVYSVDPEWKAQITPLSQP